MPYGVIVNCLAVVIGGVAGANLGDRIPSRLTDALTTIFGLCAIGMGVTSAVLMEHMQVVVFSVIVGSAIGLIFHFGEHVEILLGMLQRPFGKLMRSGKAPEDKNTYLKDLVTVLVLFCASANGIFGAMDAGFSGDHTILMSKAIMDLFTALIFGCSLGMVVSLVAIPQFVILFAIFCLAQFIYPLTTTEMILDFKGCGGLLLIATGLRVMKLQDFPLVDMIPAMIIVMPVSAFWTSYVASLL